MYGDNAIRMTDATTSVQSNNINSKAFALVKFLIKDISFLN